MRRLLCLALLVVVGAAVAADDPNALTDEEKKAGFVALFNGRDLNGWEHKGNWKIEGGVLTREGKGGDITYKARAIPDDFELRFEWKVASGSNSGVYYRPGQYEYQILDNAKHPDGQNPRTSAASLYFGVAPAKDATRPVGEWNAGRVVCRGTVVQHWLNGVKVIDLDYADPKRADEVELLRKRGGRVADRGGHLKLQDHGDPVWYRNIKLRAVPRDEKLDRTAVTPAAIPEAALKKEQEILKRFYKPEPKPQADK